MENAQVTERRPRYEHYFKSLNSPTFWNIIDNIYIFSGAYTTHQLICRMALTSYDQIPENLAEYCYVEFTMPATQVSHTTARSVSFQNHDSDNPPEKYVKNLSRHEYRYKCCDDSLSMHRLQRDKEFLQFFRYLELESNTRKAKDQERTYRRHTREKFLKRCLKRKAKRRTLARNLTRILPINFKSVVR